MAKNVRVTALAPRSIARDPAWDYETAVNHMIAHWDSWFEKVLCDKPDLIVLPECCDRYSDLTREERKDYYRVRGNRIRDHFMEIAKREKVNIAYSAVRELPDGTFRNSTQFINRSGGIDGIYNKNYLVIEEYTQGDILYGKDAPIIETDYGRVGGAICFDLNFEPLRKRYKEQHPELIVFCSVYHGALMQNFWAYDCRSWFVSAVPGEQCTVINPVGTVVASATNYHPYVTADINLDCKVAHLDYNWEKLDALRKKYGKGVTIYDPGYLGSVLLTSECEVSADEMAREFDIELWDDYYARAMAARDLPGRLEP